MQARIDICQIKAGEATEEHPITLHYGNHFHNPNFPQNKAHSRAASEITQSSLIFDPSSAPREAQRVQSVK